MLGAAQIAREDYLKVELIQIEIRFLAFGVLSFISHHIFYETAEMFD